MGDGPRTADCTASEWALILAGCGVLAGALLHVVVLIGGPDWIAFVGAPGVVVQSGRDGTWVAPVGALAIAVLLVIWAVYAFSGAGLVRHLPLLRTTLAFVAVIFILRGAIILPALAAGKVNWQAPLDLFIVSSSLFILLLGCGYAVGLGSIWRTRS